MSPILYIVSFLTVLSVYFPYADAFSNHHRKYSVYSNLKAKMIVSSVTNENSNKDTTLYDYQSLKKLQEKCKRLSNKESSFMLSFWSDNLKCFQIFPNLSVKNRVSVTTTCITLQTILDNPTHWSKIIAWNHPGEKNENQINIKDIVSALYATTWSEDAFQTPVLVTSLCQLKAVDISNEKYIHSIDLLLQQRSKLSLHRSQPYSTYLRHKNAKALIAVVEHNFVPIHIQGTHQIGYALERSNMVAFDELCRQLAFYNSGDSAQFDVIVLTYSLLTYYITSHNMFLQSFAKGVIQTSNVKLIKSALKIIFASQMLDGTWRKGEPIFALSDSTSSTGVRKDIGNSYVFFIDLISELVGVLTPLHSQLLAPYIENVERCVNWIENNILEEMMPEECDPVTKRCFGAVVRGWRSNHLGSSSGTGGAVGWCTANVFSALTHMRVLLQSLMTSNVLTEFNGVFSDSGTRSVTQIQTQSSSSSSSSSINSHQFSPIETYKNDWNNLMDADLILANQPTTLKNELFSRLIQPQIEKEFSILQNFRAPLSIIPTDDTGSSGSGSNNVDEISFTSSLAVDSLDSSSSSSSLSVSLVMSPPTRKKFPASYSAILFGPPGTAKTTICTSLANYLQWNFITIDTACFLANGLSNIASRMTYIFDHLKGLDKTIVLFDEIEEFCLDRENIHLGMESRLLTTAMLTQLNDLRRQQSVIFLVATNRLRSFDTAVTRPGRFDMLLFVGTPSAPARLQRLLNKLKTITISFTTTTTPSSSSSSNSRLLSSEEITCIYNSTEEFMKKNWNNSIRFFTFAENEMFITAIVELISSKTFSSSSSSSSSNDGRLNILNNPDGDFIITTQDLIHIANIIEAVATIKGTVREEYCSSEMLSRA